jgi:hypothetical protein
VRVAEPKKDKKISKNHNFLAPLQSPSTLNEFSLTSLGMNLNISGKMLDQPK